MIDPVPEGYMRDGRGALVPIARVKPIDMARNDLVLELFAKARHVSAEARDLKCRAFADIEAFVSLSAEQYEVRIGGKKGNVSLVSYDGRFKVTRQVQPISRVDERIHAAKALIDECILEWSEGSDASLVTLVNQAFQVDKQGNFSVGRLMMLRKANIDHPKWKRAMEAIADSIDTTQTASYVRFYERIGDTDKWRMIPLDIAAA
ncbi:MAG: DUF3164 family protein [Parvibaculum sedimenti]|uniref:DUF3164 family protein n=1 Tax=Parvibaculum sedimenti TaxID=2608632 RepID=UPI003BB7E728